MSTDTPRPSRHARRPPLVLVGLCAMVGMLGAIVWALLQEPAPLGMLRLADGSVVRLEAVTVGPVHRFVSGPWWKRLLGYTLPPGSHNPIVGTIHTYSGYAPREFVFWTVWRPASSTGFVSLRAVVFDEHGCQLETSQSFEPLDGNEQVVRWIARAAPRRNRWIGLRLVPWSASGGAAPVAEFRMPNPAPGPYPV